jgi:diaminohydroxyphosphoribosylaminopyrimidine deaminase / 5-amino-6-(5-phosphoribosylamino)uracil reductase
LRILSRSKALLRRIPRAKRAADFDRAVAEFFMRLAIEEAAKGAAPAPTRPSARCW